MSARLLIGTRAACTRCGQDVEWHGREHGWRDRGNGRECLPYEDRKRCEIVRPKGKHTWRAAR